MKDREFIDIVIDSLRRRLKIHISKNRDYADPDECLGNFKRCAIILSALFNYDFKASDVAIIYTVLKVDRFCNLVHNNKKPSNEGLQDTIDDLKNYVDFIEGCWIDEQEKSK